MLEAVPAHERVCVLLNPRAAGGRAAALHEPMLSWLRANAQPQTPELLVPAGIDTAREALLRLPRNSRVVIVGGDGSVQAMLPALLERGHTLALVPLGSGNDLARALGLHGMAWRPALLHALGAPARSLDLGCFRRIDDAGMESSGNAAEEARAVPASKAAATSATTATTATTLFASSLTAGFDSAVAARAAQAPAWLRGMPRYLGATLAELLRLRRCAVRVRADGRELYAGEALFASVLNTPSYGSGMPAVPHAQAGDGRLDLIVAGRFGKAGAALMLPRLLAGRHLSHPRVKTQSFTACEFEAEKPIPIAADGEPLGSARRWRIDVLPAALLAVHGPRVGR